MGPPTNGAKDASGTSSLARMFAKAKAINEEDSRAEAEEEKNMRKVKKEPKDELRKPRGKPKTMSRALGLARAKAKAKAEAKAKAKAKSKAKGSEVKVKQELDADTGRRKRVLSAKAKAKAKGSTVKVKRELDADAGQKKQRRMQKGDLSAAAWQKQFYVYQSGFIDQVMATDWDICFGALGTGLVGVRSQTKAAQASADASEQPDAVEGPGASAKDARGLRKDDVLILFRNAPKCCVQWRGGFMMAGYQGGSLDLENRTVEWSSQRSDLKNKILDQIIEHVAEKGRALFAVRPANSKEYRLLGHISSADGVQPAQCLVAKFDTVIKDMSGVLHKAMTAACLTDQMKEGGPLCAYRCGNPDEEWLCKRCCYRTGSIVFHFDEFEPAGVEAYFADPAFGRSQVKEEEEEADEMPDGKPEDPQKRPTRRLWSKGPLSPSKEPPEEKETPGTEGSKEDLSSWPQSICIKKELSDF